MAFQTYRRSVTSTAGLLYTHPQATDTGQGDFNAKHVALINASAAPATVYLGASDVTTSTGARWIVDAGRTLAVEVEVGESLYAIIASGSQEIDVLTNGR